MAQGLWFAAPPSRSYIQTDTACNYISDVQLRNKTATNRRLDCCQLSLWTCCRSVSPSSQGEGCRYLHSTVLTFAGGRAFLQTWCWPAPATLTLVPPQIREMMARFRRFSSAVPLLSCRGLPAREECFGPAVSLGERPDLRGEFSSGIASKHN